MMRLLDDEHEPSPEKLPRFRVSVRRICRSGDASCQQICLARRNTIYNVAL